MNKNILLLAMLLVPGYFLADSPAEKDPRGAFSEFAAAYHERFAFFRNKLKEYRGEDIDCYKKIDETVSQFLMNSMFTNTFVAFPTEKREELFDLLHHIVEARCQNCDIERDIKRTSQVITEKFIPKQ